MSLLIYPFIYLCVYLFMDLFIYLCVCVHKPLSVCKSASYLSTCLSFPVCLSAYLPARLPVCLSISLCACLSVCLSACLPASRPACLSVRHVFCTNVSLNVRLFIYVCTEVGRQVGVSTDVCMVSKNNVFKGCNICNAQQRSSVCVLNPRTLYCMLHTLHRFLVL
jgi:hypothetical protein